MNTQLLSSLPLIVIFFGILIGMIAAYEIGFRIGGWRETHKPGEKEGPTGALVASLLGFMAFLVAITMGMASDRFDTRRGLVQQEANAIRSTYLRAGYLPAPQSDQLREIMREYVPLRIGTSDLTQLEERVARSDELLDEAWVITENFIRENFSSDAYAAFVDSLDDTIETAASRLTAINNRVPEPILLFLIVGSVLAVGLVGFDAGLRLRRSLAAAVLLIVLFTTVLYLVIDINQPASGIFTVSQQPLITLQNELGPPVSQ
jgi:hypothetical protein